MFEIFKHPPSLQFQYEVMDSNLMYKIANHKINGQELVGIIHSKTATNEIFNTNIINPHVGLPSHFDFGLTTWTHTCQLMSIWAHTAFSDIKVVTRYMGNSRQELFNAIYQRTSTVQLLYEIHVLWIHTLLGFLNKKFVSSMKFQPWHDIWTRTHQLMSTILDWKRRLS